MQGVEGGSGAAAPGSCMLMAVGSSMKEAAVSGFERIAAL
jgi:hypothetical protein